MIYSEIPVPSSIAYLIADNDRELLEGARDPDFPEEPTPFEYAWKLDNPFTILCAANHPLWQACEAGTNEIDWFEDRLSDVIYQLHLYRDNWFDYDPTLPITYWGLTWMEDEPTEPTAYFVTQGKKLYVLFA